MPEEERAGHRQRRGRDDVAAPSFEPVCHASRPESQQLPNGISIHGGLQVHSIQDFPGYHDSRDAAAQDEGREHRGCRNIGRGKKAVVGEMPEGLQVPGSPQRPEGVVRKVIQVMLAVQAVERSGEADAPQSASQPVHEARLVYSHDHDQSTRPAKLAKSPRELPDIGDVLDDRQAHNDIE